MDPSITTEGPKTAGSQVSKSGLPFQLLNTKYNSACFSSLAFILSPPVYCTSSIKEMGDIPQGCVPTELFSTMESQ